MTEQPKNIPNFANRPPLNENTDKIESGADYAQKDSEFNREINHCADELLNHSVEPGTDDYMQYLGALQHLADFNYPNAQLKYALFLDSIGAKQSAGFWYSKASQNQNSGSELKKEIDGSKPTNKEQNSLEDVRETRRYLKEHAHEKDSPEYKKMEQNLEKMAQQGVPEAKEAQEEHLNQKDNEQPTNKKQNSLFHTLGNNSNPKEDIVQMQHDRNILRKRDSFQKEILKAIREGKELPGTNSLRR